MAKKIAIKISGGKPKSGTPVSSNGISPVNGAGHSVVADIRVKPKNKA